MTDLAPTWLPLGFHDWLPAAQAVTLGLLTFVQEDVPTVTAALLAAAGTLAWEAGFIGCFLGIWIGDALLYGIARGVGRPLLERKWARRFFNPDAVARSERWFGDKGVWLLLSSRFVPGTRLPTYVAAGFLRLPFGRFLLVTGAAVAVWTLGIFTLAYFIGPELLGWLKQWNTGGWALLALVVLAVVLLRVTQRLTRRGFWRRLRAAVGRWTRWEFWPAWLFYGPVALNYLRLAVRHRGFTLPTASNPGIFFGGFLGESKIATLRDLSATSPEFTAEARLLEGASPAERLASFDRVVEQPGFGYPVILKPDHGQRGVGVKLIRELAQVAAYVQQTDAPLIVQRYAPGPFEAGVFYYRFPDEAHGRLFAITEKIFPVVTGDGRSTLEELIWADERARFVAERYLHRFAARRLEVPAAGERVKLVEAGNHAQGCIFRDGWRLWSRELEDCIDAISQRLDGFYVGRYDVRYASEDDLRSGRNFQIIELNGASSEATSIYDARNSLRTAYQTLFRQWEIVFAIGAANRRRGITPARLPLLWRRWRETLAQAETYPLAD